MHRKPLIGLAVVMLGASLFLAACGRTPTTGTTPAGTATDMRVVIVTVLDVPEMADAFKPGQAVRIKKNGVTLGTIESVQVTAAVIAVPTADGHLVSQPSPVSKEVRLVIAGQAQVRDGAYFFSGSQLWLTAGEDFVTPTVQFRGPIVSIEPKAR